MNGIVTIKQGGRLIGRVSFKRPSYKNVSESYMEIFPPKDAAVDPVFLRIPISEVKLIASMIEIIMRMLTPVFYASVMP